MNSNGTVHHHVGQHPLVDMIQRKEAQGFITGFAGHPDGCRQQIAHDVIVG